MMAPLRQMTEFSSSISFRPSLPILAVIFGLILGGVFSIVWSGLSSLAAIALWPLSLAVAMATTAFLSNRRGTMRWDLLFAGQLLGVIGAVLFLVASLA